MSYEIDISNQQQRLAVDETIIRTLIENVLDVEQIDQATISVAIVDDTTIHRLNREYLQHDYETDVLSFVLSSDGQPLDGEVIVSADTAVREAPDFKNSALEELYLYVVHGTLHLVGYRDKAQHEKAQMREQEARHMKFVSEVSSDDLRGNSSEQHK